MKIELKKIISDYRFLIILIIIFLVAFGLIASYLVTDQKFNWQSQINHQANPRTHRLLDGRLIPTEKSALRPIAVMLENHVDSRPLAGLESASIIYESIVEGDITRFLAIFDPQIKATRIGPVRSVRPFFVELAEEWQVVLFHAGGSSDAMYKLTYSPVYSINEISADGIYFWRDPKRNEPHNLFTSADLMKRAITAKEIEARADFSPWLFKKENAASANIVSPVKVEFASNPDYQVEYQYNPINNDYTRYLAGEFHKTESGIILKAKNIIVQYVDYRIIDDYGRLEVNVKSGGVAEIYQDGRKIEGEWKKSGGRTRFYNQTGEEVEFNPGTIWIELVFN
ncbi:MAG: DUF3048 domain-containing protein [Patescibacteria group bacterium]|jgi:hypothetical protein